MKNKYEITGGKNIVLKELVKLICDKKDTLTFDGPDYVNLNCPINRIVIGKNTYELIAIDGKEVKEE
jgi:ABC-type iron transport system FetAB ATPase subunit